MGHPPPNAPERFRRSEFGEVISFDATFRTNKYKMVFVPFTAVDHHKKSITVGVGLLSRETIESYEWLLNAFLRAHEGKTQKIVLTDQDVAIKEVVEFVLPNSRHILCMLHIMKKLQAKELDHQTKKAVYKFISPRPVEKHVAKYIKKSIKVPGTANTNILEQKNGWQLYKVEQLNKNSDLKTEFEVEIKLPTNDVKCTCEHFNRFGTLCRHAFNILMKHGIKEIPEQYIENRWREDVISRHYNFGRHVYDTGDSEINRSVNQAYYNFEACLEYVRKNKEKMDLFVKKTESMLKEYENDPTNELQKNRTDVEEVGKLMGITIPKDIDINVPNCIKIETSKQEDAQDVEKGFLITCGHAQSNLQQNNHQKLHRYLLL
uniref:SWIM-type domain-containing protein n=1 Tax=Lactuca sativa TaxID=4236 RepID=A0A9R1XPP6_LACSA|nr:hypothetical protein LSAT_V11C300127800 [Lactuca sativa]